MSGGAFVARDSGRWDVNDDELDDLMYRMDPAQTVRDERLDAEIQREIARITSPEPEIQRTCGVYVWPGMVVPALLAAVVAVAALGRRARGIAQLRAATPPLLMVAATSLGVEDVVERAMCRLSAVRQSEHQRRSVSERWYLQTELGASRVVSPQRVEVTWTAELAGCRTVTAGPSYAPFGTEIRELADGLVPPQGHILQRTEFARGEMSMLFRTPPPAGVDEMGLHLEQTMEIESEGDVLAYIDAVRILLDEWTLSSKQMASVVSILGSFDEVEVAGNVMDRLGRAGVALQVTSASSPHFRYLLVLSRESGSLIALETIYLGGLAELDLPAPCVTDYVAWR